MGFFSVRVSRKAQADAAGAAGKKGWTRRETFDEKPYFYNLSDAAITPEQRVRFEKPDALKTEEERAKTSGEWVWAPHPSDFWQPAKVMKRNADGSVVVQPYKGTSMTIPKSGVMEPCRETGNRRQEVPLWPVNFTALEYLEDDVIQLDPVNEATILHNTRARYMRDDIYTWVGAGRAVLLALNPYRDLPASFDEASMAFHKSQDDKPDKWIPPHIFAIANEAYDSLTRRDMDQSILISGESGAGKTESTKHVLEFFAKQVGSDAVDHRVAEKLLLSSPLLEAFGNAATIRNHNSSRYGRWVQVSFSRDSNKVTGAKFTNFMLEKTRVIHHQERERSYHIFYMILQDAALRGDMGLEKPKAYKYLAQSKLSTSDAGVPNWDDASRFATVRQALGELEFDAAEQTSIFRTLAGVLNLGNIGFKDKAMASGVTGSEVLSADEAWLAKAADFFGVPATGLREVLSSRTISARGEETSVALDGVAAKDAADALSKSVYGKLFNYLVRSINESMAPPTEGLVIGVLDIFGFEILEQNSFEQLCINYCNQKLQQYFNAHTFDAEETFYKTEGVDYAFLKFIDNQPVLDLLEAKPNGMLLMLDDEGNLPGGSDKGWLGKVEKLNADNPLFETDFRRKFESVLSFEVKFYADTVKFDATGFVTKNKDTMWNDLYALMSSSSDKVLATCFPAREQRSSATKPVAAQFRGHVNDLLKLIQATEVRFVRCIKPNAAMSAQVFESTLVQQQLRYSGVFETIDIRQGGFPFRLTHKQFAFRFACIHVGHKYRSAGSSDWAAWCAEILQVQPSLAENVVLGNTMALYRVQIHKPLELARHLAIELTLPRVQAFIRGAMARFYASQLGKAQRTLLRALKTANDIALVREGFDLADATKQWLAPNLSFLPAYPMRIYEQGRHLESRLMAWEALEAEMNTASSGKQPAGVDVHLYKLLIAQCKRADKDLADVKRTAAQQELYEFCQELIRDSPPGKMDAAAGPALESLDRARMQAIKDQSDEIGYMTETVERIAYILKRLLHLDAELPASLEVLDSVRMKQALDECRQYKHVTDETREIERLFALPELEFVQMELDVARRVGDKPRELHRRIRKRELQIEARMGELKDYTKSGHMRDALNYAKGAGMCGRSAVQMGMLRWSPKALPAPLTLVPGEVLGSGQPDSKEVKALKKLCKAQFLNVQRYMGDKKAASPDKFAQKVIDFGIGNPGLRNEVYFQLIKQLTSNPNEPNAESTARGFELLGLVAASFLPSDGFQDYLVVWLRQNAPGGDWRQYTSAIHRLQFREEDEAAASSTNVADLRADLAQLREEGSRFSIAIDAFTGPTEAMREAELAKILAAKNKPKA